MMASTTSSSVRFSTIPKRPSRTGVLSCRPVSHYLPVAYRAIPGKGPKKEVKSDMPSLRCIKDVHECYMHPTEAWDTFKDINGQRRTRFRSYECDCGFKHTYDALLNRWF